MNTTNTNRETPRQEHQISDTLLRLSDVETIAGFKKSKIYQLMEENRFPKPVHLGKRSVRWKSSAINNWIHSLEA